VYGSDSFSVFTDWYRRILPDAVVRSDDRVERVLMYRDIDLSIDHAPALAAPSALTVQYLLPFDPDTARDVWDTFTERFLVDRPAGTHVRLTPETDVEDIRTTCLSTWLAREIGDDDLFERLLGWVDAHYEPRVDVDRGEFGYRFGLDEPYPRGQWNNVVMNAFVAPPGTWTSLLG
jgi:hypothetical protein